VGEGEAREYHPHLTLARVGRAADLRAAAALGLGPATRAWTAGHAPVA
jgi:2'-5' RNA ligase